MTSQLNQAIAALDDVSLSARDLLAALRRRRRLRPLIHEALIEEFLVRRSVEAGLAVAPLELQAAADAFRRRHGLTSAAQTQAWLAREGLSVQDFEAALERDLLIDRLQDHLCRDRIAGHFEAHRTRYDRLRLRQITAGDDGAARELLSQLRDEGADFAELGRLHSRHEPSRAAGGDLGVVFRCQLPPAAADAVAAAQPGEVVGPIATPAGVLLLRVESVAPAQLDDLTAAVIRRELFDAWLREQEMKARINWTGLDAP